MQVRIENDMRPAVVKWIRNSGYVCDGRECLLGWYCDVVGWKFAPRNGRRIPELRSLVAVELKLSRISEAVDQASVYRGYATETWVAMPERTCERMTEKSRAKFHEHGCGLLSVSDTGEVVEAIAPRAGHVPRDMWRKQKALLARDGRRS